MGGRYHITQLRLMQEQAEEILASYRDKFGHPITIPVQPEVIARALFGLRIETSSLSHVEQRVCGALSVDEKTIYVDTHCTWRQRSFAVAHELGHWILHEDHQASQLDVGESQAISLSQILLSRRARTKKEQARLREIEANRFAAALLVPYTLLMEQVSKFAIIDAQVIGNLAHKFNVSTQTMRYRITDLFNHQLWTGPDIDDQILALSTRRPIFVFRETGAATVDYLNIRPEQKDWVGGQSRMQPVLIEFGDTYSADRDR
jgi:Zn-dependent peptidase ImmA (M78 family)